MSALHLCKLRCSRMRKCGEPHGGRTSPGVRESYANWESFCSYCNHRSTPVVRVRLSNTSANRQPSSEHSNHQFAITVT